MSLENPVKGICFEPAPGGCLPGSEFLCILEAVSLTKVAAGRLGSGVWQPLVAEWAARWGTPGLESRLSVEVSTRMRTSLGRCAPALTQLRIASFLLAAPSNLIREVLCHEAAHAAVYELHGSGVRPHGSEWKQLMRLAGYLPRVRIPTAELEALPAAVRRARVLWEHRCPVCQMVRMAGRPVRGWRCARCLGAGMRGELVISRSSAQKRQRY